MRTLALLLATVAGLAAQSRVTGVVKDELGGPIADASVKLGPVERVTGSGGRFVFEGVASGRHTVTVYASGFAELKREVVVAADLDLGTLTIEVGRLFIPWEPGPDENCHDAAGNPETTRDRLPALAIARPLPAVQPTEGVVRVKVLVVASGIVACADAVSGDARLAREAILAARQWRFPPGPPFVGYLDFRFSKRGNRVR